MTPWIQVYSNVVTHDKTYALADALRIPNAHAVGLMVCLWAWAAVNAPEGNLSGYPPKAIAHAAGWRKKPEEFYRALLDASLLEESSQGIVIRNWERYAALLMQIREDQRQKAAERVRRYRSRQTAKAASKSSMQQQQADPAPTSGASSSADITFLRECLARSRAEDIAAHDTTGQSQSK